MVRLLIVSVILVPFLIQWWGSSPQSSDHYHFFVASNSLFALRDQGYYGSESGLLTTEDNGNTWQVFDAPERTRALCGISETLFALTSDAELYRNNSENSSWSLIWSDPNRRYAYDIVCVGSSELYIVGLDDVLVLSTKGQLIQSYITPSDMSCHKGSMVDDRHLLLTCNPYRLAVIDTIARQLKSWNEGFSIPPDDGLSGPVDVKQHGNRFIACHRDGVYIAETLLSKWEMLNDDFRYKGVTNKTFCRDLLTYDSSNQWIVANGAGIHRMENGMKMELVFPDTDEEHTLIDSITHFNSYYFVSFYRLKESMGVRMEGDLKSWRSIPIYE